MLFDSTHVTALYANNKIQGLSSGESRKEVSREGSPSDNGQTAVGPAVVADLSSAALETSRGISAAAPTADQNRMANSEKEINPALVDQNEKGLPEAYQAGPLDLII